MTSLNTSLVQTLRQELLAWFDKEKRDLPWRKTTSPYAIWLSEVMLQQTQVATVIPYYEKFLNKFPSLQALAKAPLEDVLSMWQGLGYYSRARLLHKAANEMVQHHRGEVPDTVEALLKLPGFGRYTAGAVASIAHGKKAPLVDGNVARVFSRLFAIALPPGNKEREKRLWELAEQLVPEKRPGDFNQALMELGAQVCRSEKPLCLLCPVRKVCEALRQGLTDKLPPPKQRPARKTLSLAVAVWTKKDSVLLARRGQKGLFGGLWELPCAEIHAPEMGAAALKEGLHPSLRLGPAFAIVERTLTHRDLKLHLHRVTEGKVPRKHSVYEEFRFVPREHLPEMGMSTAMRHSLKKVL